MGRSRHNDVALAQRPRGGKAIQHSARSLPDGADEAGAPRRQRNAGRAIQRA
jgi:hypothetical protein